MATRLPEGQSMWVAYPDGIERVEVVEKGTGGRKFKNKESKPKNPYVVANDDDEFVVSFDDLYDSPIAASCRRAELCKGLGVEMNDPRLVNPVEEESDEDEDEEEIDEEDDVEAEEEADDDAEEDDEDEEDEP